MLLYRRSNDCNERQWHEKETDIQTDKQTNNAIHMRNTMMICSSRVIALRDRSTTNERKNSRRRVYTNESIRETRVVHGEFDHRRSRR